jgi:hypothetical protein
LALSLLSVAVPARAEQDGGGERLEEPKVRDVIPRTLLLPAWGSWGTGHPLLTGTQAAVDALSILAIYSDLRYSKPDAGAGMVALGGLVALAANRLLSLPLNHDIVSVYAIPDPAARRAAEERPRHFGVTAAKQAYGTAPALGLSLESRYARLRAAYAFSRGNEWTNGVTDADSLRHREFLEQNGYWDLGLEGKVRLARWLQLHPGMQLLAKDYRYSTSTQRAIAPFDFTEQRVEDSWGFEWVPSLALTLHPWSRLSLDLGAGWSAGLPSVEKGFRERNAGNGVEARDEALRMHMGIEIYLL